MSEKNRQWLLKSRPVGMVKESNFELHSAAIPTPGDGQILVRNRWLAFEPAMRGWIDDRPRAASSSSRFVVSACCASATRDCQAGPSSA